MVRIYTFLSKLSNITNFNAVGFKIQSNEVITNTGIKINTLSFIVPKLFIANFCISKINGIS